MCHFHYDFVEKLTKIPIKILPDFYILFSINLEKSWLITK